VVRRKAAAAAVRRAEAGARSMRDRSRLSPGAKDLKSVLFNWTWRMGMLRSGAEAELIKTLDYHAEGGTIQVDGQPCTLTKYRVQANYQVPGYRAQIECTRANGQKYSNVETVSGDFAWDEDIPGAELVPGKGKATPKAGGPRGTADPSLGKPSRCGEGRHRRRRRRAAGAVLRSEPGRPARSPGSCGREIDHNADVAG
jgi:hypothetical protein